ncbi:hypothetical protein [Timonella senegalensis]|uniref:hypothetical protein n=1 Tax=Timonella senegalensis TaxID=1465825 RepID=UPI0003156BF1|nr:hypothetical protein [Timonella senegalensis]
MNHAQEAIEWLEDAPAEHHKGDINRANLCVAMAQAQATLALAQQQRIANMIAFLEYADGDTYEPQWQAINEALKLGDPT